MYTSKIALLALLFISATHFTSLLSADERAVVQIEAELADARLEVRTREIMSEMAQLGIAEVEIALERIALRLEHANAHGTEMDVANVKLDHKEASVQLAMRKLRYELSRLELERAKSK